MRKKFLNSIEEVRYIKEELARRAGYDAEQLIKIAREINAEAAHKKFAGSKSEYRTGTDG